MGLILLVVLTQREKRWSVSSGSGEKNMPGVSFCYPLIMGERKEEERCIMGEDLLVLAT